MGEKLYTELPEFPFPLPIERCYYSEDLDVDEDQFAKYNRRLMIWIPIEKLKEMVQKGKVEQAYIEDYGIISGGREIAWDELSELEHDYNLQLDLVVSQEKLEEAYNRAIDEGLIDVKCTVEASALEEYALGNWSGGKLPEPKMEQI